MWVSGKRLSALKHQIGTHRKGTQMRLISGYLNRSFQFLSATTFLLNSIVTSARADEVDSGTGVTLPPAQGISSQTDSPTVDFESEKAAQTMLAPIAQPEIAAAAAIQSVSEIQRVANALKAALETELNRIEKMRASQTQLSTKDQEKVQQLTQAIESLSKVTDAKPEEIERLLVAQVKQLYSSIGAEKSQSIGLLMITLVGLEASILPSIMPQKVPFLRAVGLSGEISLNYGVYLERDIDSAYRLQTDWIVSRAIGGAVASASAKMFKPKVIPPLSFRVIAADHVIGNQGESQSLDDLMGVYVEGVLRTFDITLATPHFYGAVKMSSPEFSMDGWKPQFKVPQAQAVLIGAALGFGQQGSDFMMSGRRLQLQRFGDALSDLQNMIGNR